MIRALSTIAIVLLVIVGPSLVTEKLKAIDALPYNIREVVANLSFGQLFLLTLAVLLPGLACWLAATGRWAFSRPMFLLPCFVMCGVVEFGLLFYAAPIESIDDLVGFPVWGSYPTIERLVRFVGLFVGVLSPLTIGIASVLALARLSQLRLPLILSCIVCVGIGFSAVVVYACTDNLTELLPDNGYNIRIVALGLILVLIGIVGALPYCAVFANTNSLRGVLALACAFISPLSVWCCWQLFLWGTASRIEKYDRVFSAAQFLLSTDRDHYAGSDELFRRYAVAHFAFLAYVIGSSWLAWTFSSDRALIEAAIEVRNADRKNEVAIKSIKWLAFAYTIFCIYGSWVPLHFEFIPFSEAVYKFRQLPYLTLGIENRADWVANLLLFTPLSFLWMALLLAEFRASLVFKLLIAVGLCTALVAFSCLIEFSQAWFPNRTMSVNDIVAESLGAVLGAILWLTQGDRIVQKLSHALEPASQSSKLHFALGIYVCGFVVYQLLPLDLTLSLTEIWHKFKDGKITIVPFSDFDSSAKAWYELFRDICLHIPVGSYLSSLLSKRMLSHKVLAVIGVAVLFLLGVEFLQLFVVSRHSSISDVLIGLPGACLGGWLAVTYFLSWKQVDESGILKRWDVVLALLAMTILGPLVVFWFPFNFDFSMDRASFVTGMTGLAEVPFTQLYFGSEFNAVSQVLAKCFALIPLGIALGILYEKLSVPVSASVAFVSCLVIGSTLGLLIEVGQILLPDKFPAGTDVLFFCGGCCIGHMYFWRYLLRKPNFNTSTPLRAG